MIDADALAYAALLLGVLNTGSQVIFGIWARVTAKSKANADEITGLRDRLVKTEHRLDGLPTNRDVTRLAEAVSSIDKHLAEVATRQSESSRTISDIASDVRMLLSHELSQQRNQQGGGPKIG